VKNKRLDPGSLLYKGIRTTVAPDSSLADLLPDRVHPDSPRPDTPSPANMAMRASSELPHDLMGGTRRMQERSNRWLKQEAEESRRNYDIRVGRSTLFPFYKDTLTDMASRPFGQPLKWDAPPPEEWKQFISDVDGTGKDITVFAREVLLNAIHRGMDYVLVDSEGGGDTANAQDNRRVYATRIDPLSMLDVRDESDENGKKHTTYCRFVSSVSRRSKADPFSQEVEVVILELEKPIITLANRDHPERHRLTQGTRKEWRFDEETNKWILSSTEPYNPGENGIPLHSIYTQQVGPHTAEPLLEDMAWLNLAHFQSRSDHAHVMRVARLITLVLTGWRKHHHGDAQSKGQDDIVLGPLSMLESDNKDATATFLEPSGKSIDLSFKDQEQIADECQRLGARHMNAGTGHVTARAVTMDDMKTVNNLQTFCLRIDSFLRQILESYAEWRGIEAPESLQPRTNREFVATGNIDEGSRALALIGSSLSKRSLLAEAKRYAILDAEFDIQKNLDELEEENKKAMEDAMAMTGDVGDDDFDAPELEPEVKPEEADDE
jgi:hypothetical protein